MRSGAVATVCSRPAMNDLRLDVDVEMLWAWCGANGRELDGPARAEYAAQRGRELSTGPGDGTWASTAVN